MVQTQAHYTSDRIELYNVLPYIQKNSTNTGKTKNSLKNVN